MDKLEKKITITQKSFDLKTKIAILSYLKRNNTTRMKFELRSTPDNCVWITAKCNINRLTVDAVDYYLDSETASLFVTISEYLIDQNEPIEWFQTFLAAISKVVGGAQ